MTRPLLSLCLLGLLFAARPADAAVTTETLRCGARLVSSGDLDIKLTRHCGDAYFIDAWSELHSERTGPDSAVSRLVQVEDRFYDFGPDRLLVRARLHDGRVTGFERLDRRCRPQPLDDCSDAPLLPGLGIGELVSLCGKPLQRQRLPEAVHHGIPPVETVLPARRERWLYGRADRPDLVVWLSQGRLEQIERRSR